MILVFCTSFSCNIISLTHLLSCVFYCEVLVSEVQDSEFGEGQMEGRREQGRSGESEIGWKQSVNEKGHSGGKGVEKEREGK